jgi:hypothetical protein
MPTVDSPIQMKLSAVFGYPDFLRGVKQSLQARHYLSFLDPNKDTLERKRWFRRIIRSRDCSCSSLYLPCNPIWSFFEL